MTTSKVPSQERLRELEAVIFDCDGVLTNGEIFYDAEGRRTLAFYARDGLGMAVLTRAGIKIGILSGRPIDIAEARHRELGVSAFKGSCRNKVEGVREMCAELGVSPDNTAFVGDDIIDLGGFSACGLRVAVADAAPELIEEAHWVTNKPGGRGAAREVCETIMKARGEWNNLIERIAQVAPATAPKNTESKSSRL